MLKILLKNRLMALADQFTGQTKGKKAAQIGTYIGMMVMSVLILAGMCIVFNALLGGIVAGMALKGYGWVVYAAAGGLGFIIALMVTMFYAQGLIFEAKDNELLLSMPISPGAILASRMGSLYFLNAFIILAMEIAAGYTSALRTGGISALSVILLILCSLLLGLLSTTLTCLVAWLISVLTRRTGRKTLIQLLLSLAAIGVLFLVTNGVNKELLAKINDNIENIGEAFRNAVYPLYAMGQAIAEIKWLQLLIFAAICIVPFALVYLLLSKSFIRIVTAKPSARKQQYEATALKGSSVVWAMTKKDLTRFFNSSSYMLNAGLGLLYCVGIAVVSLVSGNQLIGGLVEQLTDAEDPGVLLALISAFIMSFFACMTSISGCSISVEGRNLWILKSMPVRAKEILTGKFLSHILLAGAASLISSVMFLFVTPRLDVRGALLMILMPLAANAFCGLSGVIANLYFGKLDYPSIAKAAKSAGGALIPALITLLALGLPIALYVLVLSQSMSAIVFGLIMTAYLIALDAGMYLFLGSAAAQKRWDALGNR